MSAGGVLALLMSTAVPNGDCGLRVADCGWRVETPRTLRTWHSAFGVAPTSIIIATTRGETVVRVAAERGHPALALPHLARVLPVVNRVDGVQPDWAVVEFGGQPFRFLLGAPVMVYPGGLASLAGGAYVARDTLFVPLQWLTEYVPRMFAEGYRWDPLAARFEEARLVPVITRRSAPAATRPPASTLAREHGLSFAHRVVVDAGHGGRDPGTRGRYFPNGVSEKDITLAIAKALGRELEHRGVSVIQTRTGDTLINLFERAPMCRDDCDLFVSLHVDALRPRPGSDLVSGFATFFLDDARTAEAARVASMENEALRYDLSREPADDDPLGFILKDLHTNEYLRESALLAELILKTGADVHPGGNRGVSQAGLAVLSTARRPAILIETGFGTNRADARFLASPTGQRRLAAAIADGILTYLKQYEAKLQSAGGDR